MNSPAFWDWADAMAYARGYVTHTGRRMRVRRTPLGLWLAEVAPPRVEEVPC